MDGMERVVLNQETYYGVLVKTEQVLCAGGIVAAPTDTVYGILCRADQTEAIERMFSMKRRSLEKAFPIFVKDIPIARRYAYISDAKVRFLEKVWPGSVTVVFHHKGKFPPLLTGGKDTIGMRIPDHRFILDLLGRLEVPIVQTSANLAGLPPARDVNEVSDYFKTEVLQPDLVIDGGVVSGQSSTVFDFTGIKPLVLRSSTLNKSELEELMKFVI